MKRPKPKFRVGQVVSTRTETPMYMRIEKVQIHNDCEPGYWFGPGGKEMAYRIKGTTSAWQSELRHLTRREMGKP